MSGGSGDDLDRETEDLLSSLEPSPGEPPADKRGLTAVLDDLDEGRVSRTRPKSDSETFPRVDSEPPEAQPSTELARPTPRPRPKTPVPDPVADLISEPVEVPEPTPAAPSAAADDPAAAAAAADAALEAADPLAGLRAEANRKPRTLMWVGIISFVAAGLGAVIYTQADAFHPERDQTRQMVAEAEKERALAEHRRSQPVAGRLVVDASEPEAAVWLKLGRTPLESLAVPSGQVHYVRYELEGHRSKDEVIARSHWGGAEGGNRAEQSVKLARGKNRPPSFPAEPAVRPAPGPRGKGRLALSSTPAGAEVWLLIGFTPGVELTGVEVGRRYQLKVLKDGYRPAFARVSPDDWLGDREVTLDVELSQLSSRRRRR